MVNDSLMRALYAQQRAQIIHIKASTPDLLPYSYVYAWMHGIYPIFHDGDYSVPDRPHENFKEYFIVSADFVNQVLVYLDELWLANNSPTFYELESHFGGKDKRSALLGICRYLYLDGRFDDKLWDALLTQMKHPTEARFITSDIDEADLYIL